MKHIIETENDVRGLTRWRTSAKKYKEMDVVLFAKMNKSMRAGLYQRYIITKKHDKYIELMEVK